MFAECCRYQKQCRKGRNLPGLPIADWRRNWWFTISFHIRPKASAAPWPSLLIACTKTTWPNCTRLWLHSLAALGRRRLLGSRFLVDLRWKPLVGLCADESSLSFPQVFVPVSSFTPSIVNPNPGGHPPQSLFQSCLTSLLWNVNSLIALLPNRFPSISRQFTAGAFPGTLQGYT